MLPYLAAIGLLTTSGLPAAQVTLVMAGYCLLMLVPALVLLAVRLGAGQHIVPVLTRFGDWMARGSTLAWIVGIVGFLLGRNAAFRLGLFT
jgi:hypothetical protein